MPFTGAATAMFYAEVAPISKRPKHSIFGKIISVSRIGAALQQCSVLPQLLRPISERPDHLRRHAVWPQVAENIVARVEQRLSARVVVEAARNLGSSGKA